jgi:integrase
MVHQLNEAAVKALAVPEKGSKVYGFAGAMIQGSEVPRGFGVRVTHQGVRSFVLRYFLKGEHLGVIGRFPDWKPALAVREAREWRQEIDRGIDPLESRRKQEAADDGRDKVEAIFKEWLTREGGELRGAHDRTLIFERLVYPVLGDKQIMDVKKSDVVRLLDGIQDNNGAVMADRTLAYVRKVFNWHASRSDDFLSPIVKGMARTKPQERQRKRILTDAEIRVVWRTAAELKTPFARFVQFCLLTGARRSEAAELPWSELDGADWTLPKARNKTKVDLLRPLSNATVAVLPARVDDCDFVFSTDGINPISGWTKFKASFDKAVLKELRKSDPGAEPLPDWHLHDLRRTCRTLMSRAGVDPDHAERCLGHVIGGIRGNYDMHEFEAEKAAAYEALAALVDRIVSPPAGNVEDISKRRARRPATA